ncbi:MAG: shikimate dehydrogenase [Candidatus Lokiarchaeota archaeon]|nr:shikimate dehydrogenase [Candidatus Lokiarchaeota archaeon]
MPISNRITSQTKVLGVLGHPIAHSMSPIMFNTALQELGLDYIYVAFDVHPDNLEKAMIGIRSLEIKGVNVTIPHKKTIIKYIDEVDPLALKIGAINTIKNEEGVLKARNTDAGGAKKSLLEMGLDVSGKNVLILGSGGVSRAIAYILAEEANKIVLTDLIENRAKLLANEIKDGMKVDIEGYLSNEDIIEKHIKKTDILINATPIGMYPKVDETPIPKELLHDDLFVFDVVYNPLETRLMKEAAEIGCETLGGLDMLVNQGIVAFEWWLNKKPSKDLMKNKIIEFLGLT